MRTSWPANPKGSSLSAGLRAREDARRHDGAGVTARSFYREHMLSCGSMRLEDGRFQARVAITSLGSQKTCAQRFLDLESFASHEAAVERALRAGKEWIDANA